jgi:hypothetical protein
VGYLDQHAEFLLKTKDSIYFICNLHFLCMCVPNHPNHFSTYPLYSIGIQAPCCSFCTSRPWLGPSQARTPLRVTSATHYTTPMSALFPEETMNRCRAKYITYRKMPFTAEGYLCAPSQHPTVYGHGYGGQPYLRLNCRALRSRN